MPDLSVNPDVKKPGEKVRLFSIGGAFTTLNFWPPQCYPGPMEGNGFSSEIALRAASLRKTRLGWLLFGECRFLLRLAETKQTQFSVGMSKSKRCTALS